MKNTYVWLTWLSTTILVGILTYNPVYLTLLLITLTLTAITYKIDIKRQLKAGLIFATLPLIVNVFFVHRGDTILMQIPNKIKIFSLTLPVLLISGPITLESIIFGLIMAILLLNMLIAFGIFSTIVNPDSLLRVTPKLFFNSSLLSSIALRFTPIISDDMTAIKDAQRSRGLNLSTGNLISRVIKHKSLIVPTMVNSLERSFNLAESMASRGYNRNRTKYLTEKWNKLDYLTLGLTLTALAILIWSKAGGLLAYWPYNLLTPTVDILPVVAIILLASITLPKWLP